MFAILLLIDVDSTSFGISEAGLDDPKQNTVEPISKLKDLKDIAIEYHWSACLNMCCVTRKL